MNLPQCANQSRPRRRIGYIEEYSVGDGHRHYSFAGTIVHPGEESPHPTGSENRRYFKLEADIEIKRSFSKTRKLKAGTEVCVMYWPLEGREI